MALEADAVRFVLLDASTAPANVLELWPRATKTLPDGFQQPTQPGAPAVANGGSGGFQVALVSQPGRLEIFLTARQTAGGAPAGIKDIRDAISHGAALIRRLLRAKPLHRIALILDLSEPADDMTTATARWLLELPFLKVPPGARDLSYQVNRPIKSVKMPNVGINRLCKWGTAMKQVIRMQLTPGGLSQQSPMVLSSNAVFTVTFDINTEAVEKAFTESQSKLLVDDLVEEASQLMTKGYDHLN